MTEYGVTAEGFKKKTFEILQNELQAAARAAFGAPNLDTIDPAGFLASVYLPALDQLTELWDLAENVYNAPDPNRATGQSYAVPAALRGVTRKAAERGAYENTNLEFDAAVPGTITRGSIRFNVADQPENICESTRMISRSAGRAFTS